MVAASTDCVFCGIVAGEISSRKVYEDEWAYAFLDLQPWSRGHTLVVPRRHVDSLLDGEPALAEIGRAVDATARLLVDRLDADGLNLVSSAGAVAGQDVFHLHVHLVPRYAESPGGLATLIRPHDATAGELDAVHATITAAS